MAGLGLARKVSIEKFSCSLNSPDKYQISVREGVNKKRKK